VAEEVVGVISVQSPMPYAFNLDTQRLLETIASQAAISIKNAQAYEQRSKDIAALQEVNVAITTKSWREIAELIVQKATELTQAEYGGLWIVDQNRLVLGAMYGRQPCQDWLPIDSQSINGWVAISDRSCNCPNVKEDPRYLQWYEDVQSNITVPLRFGGQVIGTLYTESRNLNAFSEDQLRLLQSLGDQAAVAIENTRLFRRIQEQSRRIQEQRIAELETLTQLGDTLAVLEQEILEQED
jgi:sigma-B regulation protein RsbU (phosphoserine phosphatase)